MKICRIKYFFSRPAHAIFSLAKYLAGEKYFRGIICHNADFIICVNTTYAIYITIEYNTIQYTIKGKKLLLHDE